MSRFVIITAALALASLALGVVAGRWARRPEAAPSTTPRMDPAGDVDTAPRSDPPLVAPAADRSEPAARTAEPEAAAATATADPVPTELRIAALDDAVLAELADLAVVVAPIGDWWALPPDIRERALALRGAVKNAASDGIGELTHPVVAARVAGEILARAGLELTPTQLEETARLAGEYDAAMADAEAGYGAETIRMERVLDEIELKESFAAAFLEGLTEEQRAHLAPDGRPPPFLSPLLLADARRVPFAPSQHAEMAESLARGLEGSFGVPGDLADRLIQQFFRDLAPLLDPADAARLTPTERVLLAGRAKADVLESVLRLPDVDESARQRILSSRRWVVPDASVGR